MQKSLDQNFMRHFPKKPIMQNIQASHKIKTTLVDIKIDSTSPALQLIKQEQKIISIHRILAGRTSLKKMFS